MKVEWWNLREQKKITFSDTLVNTLRALSSIALYCHVISWTLYWTPHHFTLLYSTLLYSTLLYSPLLYSTPLHSTLLSLCKWRCLIITHTYILTDFFFTNFLFILSYLPPQLLQNMGPPIWLMSIRNRIKMTIEKTLNKEDLKEPHTAKGKGWTVQHITCRTLYSYSWSTARCRAL